MEHIAEETTHRFMDLTLRLSKDVAMQAHKYIGSHSKIRGYSKYPVNCPIFPKDTPEYAKYYQSIPFLKYDMQRYELKDFPENKTQYDALFQWYGDDKISIATMNGFNELMQFVRDTPELVALMVDEDKGNRLQYVISSMISGIVERYLFCTNATKDVPADFEDRIISFVIERISRYVLPQLEIDIYVPICLATFESDTIELSEHVEIVRIPDDIHKSRKQACIYEASNEDWASSYATHMIVLHGYCYENNEYYSIDAITANYQSYPLDVIDDIMAIIRTVTGYAVGYGQILTCPKDWVDTSFADLTPLYGAKTHFINAKAIDKMTWLFPVSLITMGQTEEIRKIYTVLTSGISNDSKRRLSFALRRLNRCMLRNESDDMAIDATIGLEALLSGGTKGEITYTLSNRMLAVFFHEHSDVYSLQICRSAMRKIYHYRSKIVHGDVIKEKDSYFEIGTQRIAIEKMAVDFLRYTLQFMLHNPEYLDAKKIDDFIDVKLSEQCIDEEGGAICSH